MIQTILDEMTRGNFSGAILAVGIMQVILAVWTIVLMIRKRR